MKLFYSLVYPNGLMLYIPLKSPTDCSHKGFWFLGCPLADQDPAPSLLRLGLFCPGLVMLFVMACKVPGCTGKQGKGGQHSSRME